MGRQRNVAVYLSGTMKPTANHSRYTLSGVVSNLLRTGELLGLNRADLLTVAGLDEIDLIDRDTQIPLRCLIAITEHLHAERPESNLALVTSRMLNPHDLGVIGYVLRHSPTLGDALAAFIRYQRLMTNVSIWRLDPVAGCLTLEADQEFADLGFPVEGQLGLWVSLARKLTGVHWVPDRVRFQHACLPERAGNESFFGVPIEYLASVNELAFDPVSLKYAVVSARPSLLPSILSLTEAYLPARDTVQARLHAALRKAFVSNVVDKERIARTLGMSQRTLSRKLSVEGTTYRAVMNEVRAELAKTWLRSPDVAIHEVVFLLGYSEPSTFYRAFRRWTGQTPMAWRAAQPDRRDAQHT